MEDSGDMAPPKAHPKSTAASKFLNRFGWDLLLGSIAAFYVFAVPFTKVEESFNVQAIHDILYHQHHLEKYDHFDFPGVVPRTFIGAFFVSLLASPTALLMHCLHFPKLYSLLAVRLVLGFTVLSTLRFFRKQVGRKFGHQVEAFFVIITAFQFHLLFYCSRPLPNIIAFSLVNLAYAFWLKGSPLATLRCLTFATVVFRCDTILLFAPIALELLLTKSVTFWDAVKCCISASLLSIVSTVLLDTIMWRKLIWPELQVFWFNSVLNRSSEWGTHPFHWYFSSAFPRSLLAAYPLCLLGILLDRRILPYILPVVSFVLIYSKLPHKELRFIMASIPIMNLSAAIASTRIYNNRKKKLWSVVYLMMLGSFLISLGCTAITFMASYHNYPGGYALKELHRIGQNLPDTADKCVHIDTFAAMNGISHFSENHFTWRYSKEEEIALADYKFKNFTYLLNEHAEIEGYKCLCSVNGFARARYQLGIPPVLLVKEPKVFIHVAVRHQQSLDAKCSSCS